jgi:hypothetical protein
MANYQFDTPFEPFKPQKESRGRLRKPRPRSLLVAVII